MKNKILIGILVLCIFALSACAVNAQEMELRTKQVSWDDRLLYSDFDLLDDECYGFNDQIMVCNNGWIENYNGYQILHIVQAVNWYYSENYALHQLGQYWIDVWNYQWMIVKTRYKVNIE